MKNNEQPKNPTELLAEVVERLAKIEERCSWRDWTTGSFMPGKKDTWQNVSESFVETRQRIDDFSSRIGKIETILEGVPILLKNLQQQISNLQKQIKVLSI